MLRIYRNDDDSTDIIKRVKFSFYTKGCVIMRKEAQENDANLRMNGKGSRRTSHNFNIITKRACNRTRCQLWQFLTWIVYLTSLFLPESVSTCKIRSVVVDDEMEMMWKALSRRDWEKRRKKQREQPVSQLRFEQHTSQIQTQIISVTTTGSVKSF